ncbi:multidrug MFS transporter [Bacillus sp. FJAT-27225]|uniref:MFS transporter n=1 Tax=Bacillus sp. FJAT-27225 TaxID=1743144 RepID=UPI00080C307F|nr:MFS transporter [Bacillus sp. FJAT-27225]OCA85819.1 multidrug MFS transporter [Bacillus sp. FJAT-27225]
MQQQKIWTKDFIVLIASNFFVSITFYLLMTSMALYAVKTFNSSQSSAGLAASIFIIGAVFSRLIGGKYVDVIGRKKMLYSGLVLFLISSILYFSVESLGLLFVIRFVHGLAFGVVSTVLATAAMDSLPHARRGEGNGYYSLSSAAATAIGPFLALFLFANYGYNAIFWAGVIFSALALGSALLGHVKEPQLSAIDRALLKSGFKPGDFIEISAVPVSLIMVIAGIGYSSVVSFINSYAIEIDLTNAASLFFVVYAIFLFISRPIAGKLFDSKGENMVIYPSLILFAISLGLVGIAENAAMLLIAAALLAFGFGTLMSSLQTVAVKVAPSNRIALAISTFYICLDGGMGIGPYIIGLIVPILGFRGMYILLAAVVFGLVFLYYQLHGRNAKADKYNQVEA